MFLPVSDGGGGRLNGEGDNTWKSSAAELLLIECDRERVVEADEFAAFRLRSL